jgi:hypothetical protein
MHSHVSVRFELCSAHKYSPVIVDLTRVLCRRKAENERLQHTYMTGKTLKSHRNMAVHRENILRRYDASGDWKIGRFFMDN